MEHVVGLRCSVCGAEYKQGEVDYVCTHQHAANAPPGNLSLVYDYKRVNSNMAAEESARTTMPEWLGMWRYRSFLPLPAAQITDELASRVPAGNTPLLPAPRLREELGGASEVWIKDEGRNPSGSLKDRASAFVAVKAMLEHRGVVSTASTGNAAAALSWACAALGQRCVIFVPAAAPEAKRAQLLAYGARVVLVKGTYDDAFALCARACEKYGWYCRSTGFNPYTSEGKKTVSFEICEQLARRHARFSGVAEPAQSSLVFEAPDVVAVSVGDGNIVSGVASGFRDLLAAGKIARLPRIIAVQAEGSSAIARSWSSGTDPRAAWAKHPKCFTVADSIEAEEPRDPVRAVEAARESGGAYVTVSDAEILEAIPAQARATGVFAEPAAATAYAGIRKAAHQGLIPKGSKIVIISTGNGLKDVASAVRSVAADAPKLQITTEIGELSPCDALAASLKA